MADEDAVRAQFPGSAAAFAELRRLVEIYRAEVARDAEGVELEVRFGGVAHRKFSPGVSAQAMEHVLELMRTNPTLPVTDWFEVQDTFFATPRGERRCRVTYDTDAMRVVSCVASKTRLAEVHMHLGTCGLRAVVSREKVDRDVQDDVAVPTHVRLQQRRSVALTSRGCGPRPTWSVDLGMVWSGGTKSDAEGQRLAGRTPTYALELELVDDAYLAGRSDSYVACSVAMKAVDVARMCDPHATELALLA